MSKYENLFDEEYMPPTIINTSSVYTDIRGQFSPLKVLNKMVQANVSVSYPDVVRGLHWQTPHEQSKIVTCVKGSIHDVCLDIRRHSPTFLEVFHFYLNGSTADQLYVPRGFAHGFEVVDDEPAVVMYFVNEGYHPEDENGIKWSSIGPDIWKTPVDRAVVSKKDDSWPTLDEYKSKLNLFPL